jgi:hypothetical protein
MALGKQFEDTYWEDPSTGETKSWTREKDTAGVPHRGPTTKTNAPDDELSGHQGILFHPATATGTKDDPLVPLERRETAASLALGITDIDAYKSRVQRGANVKISDNMARTDAELLRNSLVNSMTPTREIENTKVSAYLNPRRDRGGGFAETYSDKIMIGKQKTGKWETIPERTVKVTKPSDTPIYNPKFWDWMRSNTNMHDSEIQSEQILNYTMGDDAPHNAYKGVNVHWQNPETGETVRGEDAIEKATSRTYGPLLKVKPENSSWWRDDYDPEEHGPYDPNDPKFEISSGKETVNAENLERAGFVPNIFPGEGKPSKKVHVDKRFEIEKRYNIEREREINAKMHTRFVPGEVSEKVVPEEQKWTKTPHISQGTLVHEIGHKQDEYIDDRYSHRNRFTKNYSRYGFADPLEEGFADGRRDRYATAPQGGMGDMYEDVLHDPNDPTRSMKRGYGVDHAQWKNKTHKALYAASRVAARTGDNGRDQYPSREKLSKSLGMPLNTGNDSRYGVRDHENHEHAEDVNKMALGHMVTTTPSLMKHLREQGLYDVGKQARSAYIDARRNRSREQNGGWTQPQLPGMEA